MAKQKKTINPSPSQLLAACDILRAEQAVASSIKGPGLTLSDREILQKACLILLFRAGDKLSGGNDGRQGLQETQEPITITRAGRSQGTTDNPNPTDPTR